MGLLSSFGNFIEHPVQGLLGAFQQPTDGGAYFDVDGQLIGNGGDASRPYGGGHTQQQAPDPFAIPMRRRIGALLADVGSGLSGGPIGYQDRMRSEADAKRAAATLEQQAREAGLSPQELLAMHLNGGKMGEALASRSGARVMTPGSVLNVGGKNVAGAPVIHAFDDRFGATDPLNSETTTYGAPRDPTFQEQTARQGVDQNGLNQQAIQQAKQQQLELELQKLNESIRDHKARAGLAQQRIGAAGRGGGHGGGGMPSGGSPAMDAIAAELKRRGKL